MTVTFDEQPDYDVLISASRIAGVQAAGARLIRDGSNTMYELPGQTVARIGRAGTTEDARQEVQVSRWLTGAGMRVVRAVADLQQPVIVDDRPVTWWTLIPKHRPGQPAELGHLLAELHSLPVPTNPHLPAFDPFAGISERISNAHSLSEGDRSWLSQRLDQLHASYDQHNQLTTRTVIHGDAWQGNVAVPEGQQPILLDLENVSLGHPDHDLITIAVDYTDFARLSHTDYESFVNAYGGHNVTMSPGYRTLADLQELRWLSFVLSKAPDNPAAEHEVIHRIACLRGDIPQPWTWTAF